MPQSAQRLDETKPPLPYCVYRLKLRTVIENAKADAEMLRCYRDRIPAFERRFNSEAGKLWHQLDDVINSLDALVTDAPKLEALTADVS